MTGFFSPWRLREQGRGKYAFLLQSVMIDRPDSVCSISPFLASSYMCAEVMLLKPFNHVAVGL